MFPRCCLATFLCLALGQVLQAAELPVGEQVEGQPLAAQARRVAEALEYLGEPLPATERQALTAACEARDVGAIQKALDKRCLAGVRISSEKEMTALEGPAPHDLVQQGWRVFLVKVINPTGVKDVDLRTISPNAAPMHVRSPSSPAPKVTSVGEVANRFLEIEMFGKQPLLPTLSGLELEYRILQLYCRDAGRKEAQLGFAMFQMPSPPPMERRTDAPRRGPQQVAATKLGSYLFNSAPAVIVKRSEERRVGKECRYEEST